MRRIRCHYASPEAFTAALRAAGDEQALQVYTTERFEPGEEVLAEVFFTGMSGKMLIRAIGKKWNTARPRLRVRAGGVLRCAGSEWRKLQYLRDVALGRATMSPRRRHVRQPVLVEIRWRRPDATELVPATISEISEGGALLLTDAGLSVGDEIIIEITTPGGARPLELTSIVRNTEHPDGVGVEFLRRNSGGLTRIREVIRRLVDQ
ncbi:MAG TPA: PilZ domain-containing protein [Nannocystis sp.]